MYSAAVLATFSFLLGAGAQQVGTLTAETHPALTVQKCVSGGTCTDENDNIVIDANWRWLHSTSGSTNCYTGNTWDTTLCPDAATCTSNCALDGADYEGTYGITTSGDSLKLSFVTGSNVGSRTYLMDSETTYKEFSLLGNEFTFTVDVSKLPCGLNGALYFVPMDADGGMSKYSTNKAGAKYGTGYCDAQCPQDMKFVNGKANNVGWVPDSNSANSGTGKVGSCCSEFDVWEANSMSQALTPHVCTVDGQTSCTGDNCTSNTGVCDSDGCDFNPYRMGNTTFYGSGKTIDTTKEFTVVTQFITNDGTETGTLTEIKRFYVQGDVVYEQPTSDISGVSGNSITDDFCTAQKNAFGDTDYFSQKGGMAAMGKKMAAGMVLVLSVWDDYNVNMLWLDSNYPTTKDASSPGVSRGSCASTSGVPATVEAASGSAYVTFSSIKYGPIGSTFKAPSNNSSPVVSSSSIAAISSAKASSTSSVAAVPTTPVAAIVSVESSSASSVSPITYVSSSLAAPVVSSAPVVVSSSAAVVPVASSTSTKPKCTKAKTSTSTKPKCTKVRASSTLQTSVTSAATTAASASSTGSVPLYGNCFGGKTCSEGICKVQNPFYSQCVSA
ncbi:Exoglucanase 1 [Ciborinia camelliae]|nr:Exoglucanase 1 [Ciborinia camelliae]